VTDKEKQYLEEVEKIAECNRALRASGSKLRPFWGDPIPPESMRKPSPPKVGHLKRLLSLFWSRTDWNVYRPDRSRKAV
jgi:hypothetical protein